MSVRQPEDVAINLNKIRREQTYNRNCLFQ